MNREAGGRVLAVTSGLRERVLANRAFLVRVVRHVAPGGVPAYGGVARKA